MIVDGVLKDALEQHRQLGRRATAVLLGELQHGVLDDVERRILVADREKRLLEGATLDLREKGRQFRSGSHGASASGRYDRTVIRACTNRGPPATVAGSRPRVGRRQDRKYGR